MLNVDQVKQEVKKEIKKFLELNGNESTTQQNRRDMLEAVLGEQFVGLSAYIKKSERAQKYLIMQL